MSINDFLAQWAQDAINASAAKIVKWCPVCEMRETSKHHAPYCSSICREKAQRDQLYDRR